MKKKIATRPLSGFDELDAAGIGAGYRAFEEEQPVAEAPKEKSTSLGDYSNAAGSGVLKGIAGTATGIGTFAQAPAANTLSGVLGARALVDRGVTGVRNWINPGSSALDEDVQSNARMASQFAAEERAKNSADGGIAGAAKSVEGFGRASTQALKDFDENYNPELIKQEKNVSDAKGFWGTAKATLSNPLALTGSLAQSAPDMALGVGVGSLAARSRMALGLGAVEKAGAAAAKTVAASGGDLVAQGVAANAARDAAAQALQKSATHVAGSVGVVSESASSAYGGREGTYQQVMGMPEQTLLKTPRYNAILAATGDPAKARMQFANEIADQAPMLTALGTALGSMAITKITGHDLTAELAAGAKKTTAKDIAVNALGHEGPEEVLQGIPEDLVQHGAMVQADPDHELDLGGGIAQNYIAGAVMGAGGTGASYVKDKFGKQAPVDPAAAAAKLLAEQKEAARKVAVSAAHTAASTPNSPIARAAAAANPLTPEEAWAKAQELDAQAALDEANGVEQVGPPAEPPAQQDGAMDALVAHQNADPTIQESLQVQPAPAFDAQAAQEQYRADTLAAQKAQDDELNAQAEAALAKMAQRKQQTRPVNEVVSDGGYLYEGTQDGDVLNGLGKPFSIKMGALQEAKRQARENGGDWTVAPVFDGYVARKSATNKAVEPVESAQAATKNVAGDEVERYQWQRNAEGGQKRGNQQTIQPLTEALFNEYIAPKVSAKSFSDYKQQFPAATHISLVQKSDGSVELGAGGVGPIDHLRPKAAPVEKGWVKAVDSFDSPEAIAHASAADSGALSEIDQAAHEAATSPLNDKPQPTDGQKEAGNYAKGHITVHGMDMAIENPKGSTRSGVSPDGTAWSNTMGGHYGYFKGTLGNDGDHVDGYVGPNPESNRVFVIDQVNKDGSFDEHKAMIGYDSPEQAREAYMSSFMPGWTGLGAMTELPVSAFKSWVADGVKKKPLGDISRPQPAEPVSQPQEQPSAQTAEAQQTEPQQQEGARADAEHATESGEPAAEQAGASPSEVDLSTVAGVARAVQLKVASNRRKSREKSRREREKQGFSPNSTPESEQADYEAEISVSPSELQKKSAAAMLGTDPVPLIGMFVNGNFEASEDVFKDITGVKIRGLSAKDKKAALYQWAKWTPEQIAQAEGESQARAEAAADKRMQDDFNSAVTGAWLGLDRLKVNLKSGDTITGQDFILQSVAGGFDKAHSQKKGAAVIYGLTDGSRFTTLKAREFTAFVKSAIAFGGLDKALTYVNPPKPQAPEGFVDRSIDIGGVKDDGMTAKAFSKPDAQSPVEDAAPAPQVDAPSAEPVPRPKSWENNYGAASKIAEAMGIALRGANGKMKKVPELVAEIKALDVHNSGMEKLAADWAAQDADLSKNQPKVDTSAEPVQKPAESEQVDAAQATLNRLLDPNGSPLANNLDSATHDVGISFLKELLVKAKGLKPGRTNEEKLQHKRRLEYINAALLAKETGKPGLGVKREYQDEAMANAETEWARMRDVDRMAMMSKLGYSADVARRTAGKSWENVGGVFQVKLAKAMAEPLTQATPAASTAPITGANRQERINSILANGGKVVDGTLRTSNGLSMFKLTDEEAAVVPDAKKDTSDDIKRRLQEVYQASTAAADTAPVKGLGEQLAELNAELERQGMAQNANTRAQRDAIRKQIAQEDFPEILQAVDDHIDVAEELNRAFQYAGDEPKAKTVERILKKRGITPEYQKRWTERLLGQEQEKAQETPSQTPSNTIQSSTEDAPIDPEDRAVLDAAKAKIAELDSKIERHEALLNCLK